MSAHTTDAPPDVTAELFSLPVTAEEHAGTQPPADAGPLEPSRALGNAEEQPVNPALASVAVFFATAGAAWMCAGIFRGPWPKIVAIVGAGIGPGMVALSYRTRRPSVVQYLALPLAALVGAILVLPDAQGGTANLPGLVAEAIRTGGVAQPPIPFDPGWRFLLVVLVAVVGAGAASLAIGLNRPKLGIFIPVPLLFGAALLQPQDAALFEIGIALLLFVGSLAVSFGVELASEGATSGRFEYRRLVRAGAIMLVLVVALTGLSQLGFLFPDTQRDQVVPPKRPDPQPPQKDRILFTVKAPRNLPWRLGVLDVYDGKGWLLPPYDTGRLEDVPEGGMLPGQANAKGKMLSVTFRVNDIEGHVIPTVALARSVRRAGFLVQFDPRTQMMRLPESRARRGMTYTVASRVPPTGAELAKAGRPPPELAEFLRAPQPPSSVQTIIDQAPATDAFNRLQFVRNAFYKKVVTAGAGQPKDVPPYRVADMLDGKEATPYEITAAEVLLARWTGVPARIGYGFYGGDKRGGSYEIHPKHGSTWLEAYFERYGWVPIVGIPPRAKSSLSQSQKNEQQIRPTQDLALIVYVPIRRETVQQLYTTVRYWLAVVSPIVAGVLLLYALLPGVVKILRRWWRRRWARALGPRERIVVAYAEFRDVAYELNIGDNTATALEFRHMVAADPEHDELAWLVTRALWGDLGRDLRREDAEAAEDLASSVTRRLRRAQSGMTRLLAFGARASLRDPYSVEIPRLWPQWLRRGLVRGAVRGAARRVAALRHGWRYLRRLLPIGTLLAVLTFTACVQGVEAGPGTTKLPNRLVPAKVGAYTFQREAKVEGAFAKAGPNVLVDDGRVYTIREGRDVHGYVEIAAFRPNLGARRREVRKGVLEGIAAGHFEPQRLGRERIYLMRTAEQTFYLWFPPSGRYFDLLVARQGFEEGDRIFASLLAYQRGEKAPTVIEQRRIVVTDPRRGGDL